MSTDNFVEVSSIVQDDPVFLVDRAHFSVKFSGLIVLCLVENTRWINFLHTHRVRSGYTLIVRGRLVNLEEAIRQKLYPVLIVTGLETGTLLRSLAAKRNRLSGYSSESFGDDMSIITTSVHNSGKRQRTSNTDADQYTQHTPDKQLMSFMWVEFRENINDYLMMMLGRIKYIEYFYGDGHSEILMPIMKRLDELCPYIEQHQACLEFASAAALLNERISRILHPSPQSTATPTPLPSFVISKLREILT